MLQILAVGQLSDGVRLREFCLVKWQGYLRNVTLKNEKYEERKGENGGGVGKQNGKRIVWL